MFEVAMSKAKFHGQIPAPDAVLTVLGETPGARVVDHDCRKPAGSRGSYEYGLDYGLVLVRPGGYRREVNGRGASLGPTDAFFERPFVEQRIEHHRDTGDRCTSLWLSDSAVCALAGDIAVPDEPITTTPSIDLQHRELVAALRRGIDRFEVDERLARLVGAVRNAPSRDVSPPAAPQPDATTIASCSTLARRSSRTRLTWTLGSSLRRSDTPAFISAAFSPELLG
jgi:hypothetical protein